MQSKPGNVLTGELRTFLKHHFHLNLWSKMMKLIFFFPRRKQNSTWKSTCHLVVLLLFCSVVDENTEITRSSFFQFRIEKFGGNMNYINISFVCGHCVSPVLLIVSLHFNFLAIWAVIVHIGGQCCWKKKSISIWFVRLGKSSSSKGISLKLAK